MSSDDEGNRMAPVRMWTSLEFWRWTTLFLVSYGIGHAILVGLFGLVLGLRQRSLLLPYLLLLCCGFVSASLIYWARRPYERPKSGAVRFSLAIFLLLDLYLGVFVFSACWLQFISQDTALFDYGLYILPTAALSSIAAYLTVRYRLDSISRSN